MLCSVPEHRGCDVPSGEKICVRKSFIQTLRYSAAGHEFNANASTIHIEEDAFE